MLNSRTHYWQLFRIIALVIALVLATLPYWPQWLWLQWLTLLVLYAPFWWLGGLLLPWILGWRSLTKWQCLWLIPLLFIGRQFIDVQVPILTPVTSPDLTVLSANLGNMSDANALAQLVQRYDVSVALLQEAKPEKLAAIEALGWLSHCDAGLCIASRLPYTVERAISRKMFQGYGNFAVFYNIRLERGDVMLANVHFETPRPALESLITLSPDSKTMLQRQSDRALQATIVNEWANANSAPVIIAGDFNMPALSPIYQQYLAEFGNALSEKPLQVFSYTKYTRWHGIRIDHQLYRGSLAPISAEVLHLPGADHRPVLVKWRI